LKQIIHGFLKKFYFSENFVPKIPENLVSAAIMNPRADGKFGTEISKCVLDMRPKCL
jgi:hypothetical protein